MLRMSAPEKKEDPKNGQVGPLSRNPKGSCLKKQISAIFDGSAVLPGKALKNSNGDYPVRTIPVHFRQPKLPFAPGYC